MKYFYEICIVLIIINFRVECAKILGIFHVPSPSHYHAGAALMKILSERGHEVTVVSPFGEKVPSKNYTDIVCNADKQNGSIFRQVVIEKSLWQKLMRPYSLHTRMTPYVENVFKCPKFQKLMHTKEKFDLVIIEEFCSEALKYIAHHLKTPLITFSPNALSDDILTFQGNPDNPAYTSHFQLNYRTEKNFWERLHSTVFYVISRIILFFEIIPRQNKILHQYYPNAPDLNEIIYNASLVFVNSDLSIYDAAPRVPSIISIGGYHIQKQKSLPADLQQLLDDAKDGVIYFSLGSNFQGKFLSKGKVELMLKVFSRLKYKVLWKFEEDMSNVPDNVIIQKWFPQNDILGHKNVQLFISHGGVFSLMEAVFHAVPVLGFPLFGDQNVNIKCAEKAGFAKGLALNALTETQFETAIVELLKNPKYADAAKTRSNIMLDRSISPADSVAYWVDYVIRHNGAAHLKVATLNLEWYQCLLLDVTAFILICLVLFYVTAKHLICCLMKKIRKNKPKEKTT